MILKGNQRGYGGELATHLLKDENEHIEIHELRGFASDDLHSAFAEICAISKATRCTQYLFSLSLNPPAHETATTRDFEEAVELAEQRLGLGGQPRAIVFHEKEGRRHAHAVWSRIDPEQMKAINLSWYKNRLADLSRELYITHGWDMPRGLRNREDRDPLNYSREEAQQAKRAARDPQDLKAIIRDAWEQSDNEASLDAALNEHDLALARGDRRGCVVVDADGEVYALARWAGVKARDVRERINNFDKLPSVDEVRQRLDHNLRWEHRSPEREKADRERTRDAKRQAAHDLAREHSKQREALKAHQAERWQREIEARQARLHKGLRGFWDWLSGKAKAVRQQNERETWHALRRDQRERDDLILTQLEERRALAQDLNRQANDIQMAHEAQRHRRQQDMDMER